jgi:hypothetical protein
MQDGTVSARGTSASGGSIAMDLDERVIQTSSASVAADGAVHGGHVRITAGTSAASGGHLFSSATLDASGGTGQGGDVVLGGRDIVLAAATITASGGAGGGDIHIGGGRAGQDSSLANAQSVVVSAATTLEASARNRGEWWRGRGVG